MSGRMNEELPDDVMAAIRALHGVEGVATNIVVEYDSVYSPDEFRSAVELTTRRSILQTETYAEDDEKKMYKLIGGDNEIKKEVRRGTYRRIGYIENIKLAE